MLLLLAVLLAVCALSSIIFVWSSRRKSWRQLEADEGDTSDEESSLEGGKEPEDVRRSTSNLDEEGWRRLLEHLEKDDTPTLALPAPESPKASQQTKRAEAMQEVERVMATKESRAIFGGGTIIEQKIEFRRLVRLLHPDKGLVSGPRATLALRRVVETYSVIITDT